MFARWWTMALCHLDDVLAVDGGRPGLGGPGLQLPHQLPHAAPPPRPAVHHPLLARGPRLRQVPVLHQSQLSVQIRPANQSSPGPRPRPRSGRTAPRRAGGCCAAPAPACAAAARSRSPASPAAGGGGCAETRRRRGPRRGEAACRAGGGSAGCWSTGRGRRAAARAWCRPAATWPRP